MTSGNQNPLKEIPQIGLGTWKNKDSEQCANSVRTALEVGYRHIDTAQIYQNEEFVGEGIKQSSVDRSEIFLATKVWNDNLQPEDVQSSTEESLRKLNTDYVDLLYIHWPAGEYDPENTLQAMEKLVRQEKAKYLGLSNFTPELLDEARDILDTPVFAHQIELHPYLQQNEQQTYCSEADISIVAYSPFRHGKIFDDSALREIAQKHDATPAQICLAWAIEQQHVFPIPKASSEEHIKENFEALEIDLTEQDLTRLRELDQGDRFVDPPFGPWT